VPVPMSSACPMAADSDHAIRAALCALMRCKPISGRDSGLEDVLQGPA
jgi:hypothetical protein